MYRARCRNLYDRQDALNELWILCVVKKVSFQEVASHYKYSLKDLLTAGLTRNMITRDRWFDVATLARLGGFQVFEALKVDAFQYYDWKLSLSEMDALGIRWSQVDARFGRPFCIDECNRLGVKPQFIQTPAPAAYQVNLADPELFIF